MRATRGLRLPRRSTLIRPALSSLRSARRLCIGLHAPVLQHQVGNNEGIGLPKPFKVPEGQPDQ